MLCAIVSVRKRELQGNNVVTEKSIKSKEIIKKHAIDFGGTLSDKKVITLCKISKNSCYKYKKDLKMQVS